MNNIDPFGEENSQNEQSPRANEQSPRIYGVEDNQTKQQMSSPQHYGEYPQYGATPPPKKSNKKLYILVLIFAIIGGMIGTIIGQEINGGNVVVYQAIDTSGTDATQTSYAQVSALVKDTVVEITTEQVSTGFFGQYVTQGAGSGVIISTDGYIVTNYHVIEGAQRVKVRLSSGKEYSAEIIGQDSKNDIAVLKIEETGLQPAVFGNSDNVVVGEEVIAVGNPLGELGGSVTNGIISALDREISIDNNVMTLLQTNTAINPGNSGGGLFNMKGELIGVVNAKNVGEDIDNIGFAIPSTKAQEIVENIIENKDVSGGAGIGITVVEISTAEQAQEYGVQALGVYIQSSTQDKLKTGDLILAIDGEDIYTTSDIASVLYNKKVGDQVEITVMRARRTIDETITLQELQS